MKTESLLASLALVTLIAALAPELAAAPLGTTLTYQGRVQTGGSDFSGDGQLKFALVTATNTAATATATATINGGFVTVYTVTFGGRGYVTAPTVTVSGGGGSGAMATASLTGGVVTQITPLSPGSGYTSTPTVSLSPPPENLSYTTYWSNDGTSTAGSEPTAAVAVRVEAGLFTVRLGDTGLANMTALAPELFRQRDLHLCIWFDDGVNGFAALHPSQPLTAAPYACVADSASGLLGTVGAAGLSGTYSNALTLSNPANSFAGSGAGLTGLSASQLASGTIPDARLSANVARTSEVWLLRGNAGTTAGTHFLGTSDNRPLELKVNAVRALRLEPNAAGAPNLIGGTPYNFIGSGVVAATIAGGGATLYFGRAYTNSVLADFATVGGGGQNSIGEGSAFATLAGGVRNTIRTNSDYSVISGGEDNTVQANSTHASIAGGEGNRIGTNSEHSAIGGGNGNDIAGNAHSSIIAGGRLNNVGTNAFYAAIGGGYDNDISADSPYATIAGGRACDIGTNSSYSAVGGGYNNNVAANAAYATIAGGYYHDIGQDSPYSAIGGGSDNNIGTNSSYSAVGGGYNNNVAANAAYATIAGGYYHDIGRDSPYSAIGGGSDNNVGTNASYSVIGGGLENSVSANADTSTIAGGDGNTIGDGSQRSTIGGGFHNSLGSDAVSCTISGGDLNNIADRTYAVTIAGGTDNEIGSRCIRSTIGGGDRNFIIDSAAFATIAGGVENHIEASSDSGTIGGGWDNRVAYRSIAATVPGGAHNVATNYAFAAGQRAKANHTGSFVWADNNDFDFNSSSPNVFLARCTGGVRFTTGINGTGGSTAGVRCPQGESAWESVSDRNAKENFNPVNARQVLDQVAALPLSRWNYKARPGFEHLGPVAQDFYAAFGLGSDDKHIATIDADGVALAAIQGLNQKLEDTVNQKDARIAELEQGMAELKALVNALAQRVNGGSL